MSLATETLTIVLPKAAANRLRRIAEIAQRPIDEVVAETLESTLPPLLDAVPATFQAELAEMERWPNELLQRQVFATISKESYRRYESLQTIHHNRVLSGAERQEVDELNREANLLMFRKAYAALLLKWRGQRVPTIAELEGAVAPING